MADTTDSRFYDPAGKYPCGFLKEYDHWLLEVSYRQHTLGSYIIFCRRPEVRRIRDLNTVEFEELREVMTTIEEALSRIESLKPNWFNYWQMGNKLPSLHFHGIPRYSSRREFFGRTWVDSDWKSVPVWSKVDESDSLVAALRDLIAPELGSSYVYIGI